MAHRDGSSPPRVAVYLRQSVDRGGDQLGVQRQLADVTAYLTARGWKPAKVYTENDTSALRKRRPVFEEMLATVDAGKFDVVVVRHTDRLVRRLADLEGVLARLDSAGAYLVSTAEGLDTSTDGGRLVARILGSVAQGEVERKAARQASAARQAAALGLWRGGRRPFGWLADGVTPHPEESPAVIAAYAAVLAGEPLTTIARRWAEQFGTSPQGGTFTRNTVRDVLTNPRQMGKRRHRTVSERPTIRTDAFKGITGDAEWPQLVSEETWRGAVAIICHPARRRGGRPAQVGLLTGIAVCSVCGRHLHRGGSRASSPTYRCVSGKHVVVQAGRLDDYVSGVVLAYAVSPDLAALAGADGPDTPGLLAEADAVRARLDELAEDMVSGLITRKQLHAATAKAQARLDVIEAELATAGADPLARLLAADDPVAEWDVTPLPGQRAIIAAMVVPVVSPPGAGNLLHPDDVELRWRRRGV